LHKIIDIVDFMRRSLYERDRTTLMLNGWTPFSSYDLHLMLSAKAFGILVKSAHKNWKKAKENKFCAETFDAFLKLCKNEGSVDVRNMLSDSREKNHRSKQNSAETSN